MPARKKAAAKSSKKPKKEPIVELPEVEEQPAAETETAMVDRPAPNIRFTSDPAKTPPKSVRIGMKVYELPDAETQRAGFFHSDAAKLIRTIKDFKEPKAKG
jgi:hypothetical protein